MMTLARLIESLSVYQDSLSPPQDFHLLRLAASDDDNEQRNDSRSIFENIEVRPRLETDILQVASGQQHNSLEIDCFDADSSKHQVRFYGLPKKVSNSIALNLEDASLYDVVPVDKQDASAEHSLLEAISKGFQILPPDIKARISHDFKTKLAESAVDKDSVYTKITDYLGINLILYDVEADLFETYDQELFCPFVILLRNRQSGHVVVRRKSDDKCLFPYSYWRTSLDDMIGSSRTHPNHSALHLTKYKMEVIAKVADLLNVPTTCIRSGKIKAHTRQEVLAAIKSYPLTSEDLSRVKTLLQDIKTSK